jgi:hypothetical protein
VAVAAFSERGCSCNAAGDAAAAAAVERVPRNRWRERAGARTNRQQSAAGERAGWKQGLGLLGLPAARSPSNETFVCCASVCVLARLATLRHETRGSGNKGSSRMMMERLVCVWGRWARGAS